MKLIRTSGEVTCGRSLSLSLLWADEQLVAALHRNCDLPVSKPSPAGHPAVLMLVTGASLIAEFGPTQAAGMSEGCYCRLAGVFSLEANGRWGMGWVSLLKGATSGARACVCVCIYILMCVHRL